jgi:hypothetical protein
MLEVLTTMSQKERYALAPQLQRKEIERDGIVATLGAVLKVQVANADISEPAAAKPFQAGNDAQRGAGAVEAERSPGECDQYDSHRQRH